MEHSNPLQNENRHARTLHVRQARFVGPSLTNWSIASDSLFKSGDGSLQHERAMDNDHIPLQATEFNPQEPETPRAKSSSSPGVLQEITNVNSRRRRPLEPISSPLQDTTEEEMDAPYASQSPCTKTKTTHQASASNSSKPLNRRPERTRLKASTTRRSFSGATTRYMEHLESQLAALQTQIQSLTSPSSSRSHSAKLRALNSENKMLQEELAGWETRFEERLQERTEHYERVTGHMRGRIGDFEGQLADRDRKLVDMEIALGDKQKQLESTEGSHRELERRLEFMSSLVATSPGEMDHHGPPTSEQLRKRISKRMSGTSISSTRTSSAGQAIGRIQAMNTLTGSPSATDMCRTSSYNASRPEDTQDLSRDSGYSTDMTTDFSDTATLLEVSPETDLIPSRRASPLTVLSGMSDTEPSKSGKPARRMRRFYAGSARQSLILPSTITTVVSHFTSAVERDPSEYFPCSAPTSATPSPHLGAVNSKHKSRASLSTLQVKTSGSGPKPGLGIKRSSTWSEDDTFTIAERRKSLRGCMNQLEVSSTEHSANTHDRVEGYLIGRKQGRNLFEELSKIKQEREHARVDEDSCGATSGQQQTTIPQTYKTDESEHRDLGAAISGSTLMEPNDEIQVDADYHTSRMQLQTQSLPFNHQWCLARVIRPLHSFLGTFSHPLSSFFIHITNNAKFLFPHIWETLTLSRPVLEFRIWLVRLLLGRLRHKHGALLVLHRRLPLIRNIGSALNHPTGSTVPGLGLGSAGCQSCRTSADTFQTARWEEPAVEDTPRARWPSSYEQQIPGYNRVVATSTPRPPRCPQHDGSGSRTACHEGCAHRRIHDGLDLLENGHLTVAHIPGTCTDAQPPRVLETAPQGVAPSVSFPLPATEDDVRLRDPFAGACDNGLGCSDQQDSPLELQHRYPDARFCAFRDDAPPSGLATALRSRNSACCSVVDGNFKTLAVSWLEFPAMIVVALGIALLDGPGALFES